MEHKLGETFTWNGHTLEVAEVEDPDTHAADAGFLSTPQAATEKDLNVWTKTEKTTLT